MIYNFVKNSIAQNLSSYSQTIEELENFVTFSENSFILKHNIDGIIKILKFLDSNQNIFILNGFMGSGKTNVADNILNYINDDVLIFKNSYKEAINLDDILLSLFKDFSNYHNEKKVILPKTDTTIFSEKINTYIKYCNVPMLFIFDSFEINMRSKDSQKDIIDYIDYLSHFDKVKILICSRSFRQDDLISEKSALSHSLKTLTKEEMLEYLKQNNIECKNYETEDIYKISRGHYLLLELSVLIINLLDIKIDIFINEYKKSAKNFLEFLVSKILSLSSDKFTKLLIFLYAIRHGVSLNFLIENNIATEEDINFLIQKRILAERFNQFYIKDYVKKEIDKIVNIETRLNIHKYLINIYEKELPLKPFDRKLFLSRITMRQEIAYHTQKISSLQEEFKKNSKNKLSDTLEFNYINYKGTSHVYGQNSLPNKRYINKINKNSENKNEEIKENTAKLSYVDEDKFNEEIKNPNSDSEEDIMINPVNTVPDSLSDYLKIAQDSEASFNYSNAILYYKKALTFKNDASFKDKEPLIYSKLAVCYKKIQDIDEAVNYYEKVYNIYKDTSLENAVNTLFNIAKTYSESYKFLKAKEVYKKILSLGNKLQYQTKLRAYIDLSDIEENSSNINEAIKYIQTAMQIAENNNIKDILSQCYFKYALLMDDSVHKDIALKYYLRCAQLSDDPTQNPYLSSAYINLAELSKENNNLNSAKMYYELAINADQKINNHEGLCYSLYKLSEIYKGESSQKAYELLTKALSSAKRLTDTTYIIKIYYELGDLYLNSGDYKRALKSYILSKTFSPDKLSQEFNDKINSKINKIKIISGEEKFNTMLLEIKKKK